MSTTVDAAPVSAMIPVATRTQKLGRLVLDYPLGAFGAVVLLIMVLAAIFAPLIAPYDPTVGDSTALFQPPSAQYLLGTDAFGRDILSRLIYGARISLMVGFGASTGGIVIGTTIGVLAGYLGGWFDTVSQRIMDALLAFPMLLLALAITSVLGPSLTNVIIALGLPIVPRAARIARASTMSLINTTFIEAARATGCSDTRIIFRHILPNTFAPLLVIATAYLGLAIVQEAALDYLGAGIQEPQSSWGLMMTGSATSLALTAPWIVIIPGLAICLAVLSSNFLGDAIRDALDPKLQRSLR
ncbi:ABC transporter permease [Mesorhizobium sp. CAU 1741]|uniref:ABC transporter permease n=1 Tax=Mesorhizobium sp. CAU 1741 TaxID=3140366 RepID=UPI00325A61EA